ncbi:hypothetical protein VTK73DRAFT_9713 [Phialemonium thermophilum]|uniref:Major facilitator superfamily (MFS) profile domain-containing protein n=1 Tax=Phialemonium thermophilum TaxID=223376 RepID=A0ABR3XJZ0_9PEZI
MRSSALSRVWYFLSGTREYAFSGPPRYLKFRSSSAFIIITVCLAIFTDILFYGLIVPVIPFSLTDRVGVPEDSVQRWTAILLACYNVTLFLGSPLAGIYADRTASRRLPFLLGLLALAGSTLLLCLGRSVAVLIIGRLLQGLSAAIVWSVGLALLVDTVGRNVGYAMGWVTIAMSAGLLISPVIGGAVYAAAGYYAVFYVAFGVIFCDIVLRLVLVEKKVARQWIVDHEAEVESQQRGASVDEPGSSLRVKDMPSPGEGDVSLVVRESPAGPTGFSHQTPTPRDDQDDPTPQTVESEKMPPYLRLLKSRRLLAALFGCFIQAGIMFSFDTVVPLFVKDTFHWSSTAAGLVFMCIMVPSLCSPFVGILSDRFGAKWPALAGFLVTIPLLVCLRFVTNNTIGHKVLFGALLALVGLCCTFANTPLMAEITYGIEAKEAKHPGIWGEKGVYGIGYGLYTTSYAFGGTAGSLMAGYIQAGPGWGTATWSLAIWCAVGTFVVAFWVGGKPIRHTLETGRFNQASSPGGVA